MSATLIKPSTLLPQGLRLEQAHNLNLIQSTEPFIVKSRQPWVKAGCHPTADDPQITTQDNW
ncbi:MAG: hypothetical protein AAFX78_00360 [Cyanobacteria bacterium J06638_20]